jgi:hypothetical protein
MEELVSLIPKAEPYTGILRGAMRKVGLGIFVYGPLVQPLDNVHWATVCSVDLS